jgi:hypothetical protein
MHLWYSQKAEDQKSKYRTLPPTPFHFAKMKDGSIVRYTAANNEKHHGCAWDDMVYLGEGEWHHNEVAQ